MSIEIIEDTNPKARKDYLCDACWSIRESMVYPDDFLGEDLEALKRAEANGWKIKKGDTYFKQKNKVDGELSTFRCIPEIADIYFKNDLND